MRPRKIAIVGDFRPNNLSHRATTDALNHSVALLGIPVVHEWLPTLEIAGPGVAEKLAGFSGLWIAPGSPYESLEGALFAIRHAREQGVPLLGTCGGFQHMLLEYARNVLGLTDAEHEESSPGASRLFISRLACSLVDRTGRVRLEPGSFVARLYGRTDVQEPYRCNFGLNPKYLSALSSGPLRVVGSDDQHQARVVELGGHPFFIGTLYVPQHNSTPDAPHPVVTGFLQACSHLPSPNVH